ncbi:MAG TPA: hypothetical protein VGY76_11220 [Solirubrobacteraceae bacterium]|nr:hypothetical protein [Solirubrobacteraceae bacterium]
MAPRVRALAVALCMALALPASARASQSVNLFASFSPNKPRASTTITFGFTVVSPKGQVPSPLEGVDLHLPGGIGLARNTLGTAVCEPIYLFAHGPNGCPANSRIGYGLAVAAVPYGPLAVHEQATVDAYRGVSEGAHLTILFFAEGWTPVFADLVFPGQLLEDQAPYSGRIDTKVPLVPSLPGGPNVSVVRFQSTFGPKNLLYEREINGEIEHFHPRGVTVPATCPAGGYPFAGDFRFEDGTQITVHTSVPCAGHARSRARRGHGARGR